jgi:SPASM domain peptide maturase of grasp-with-spasm system
MNEQSFLVLFADCKLTKGYTRTLAVDLTRGKTYIIENDAYDVIISCRSKPYQTVLACYSTDEQLAIKELVQYLIEKDLCFFTENPQAFPMISDHWETPSILTNAIIDVDKVLHDYETIIPQLTDLGCYDVQFRFYSEVSLQEIESLLAYISDTSIKSVDFYIKSSTEFSKKALKDLTKRYFKIKNLIVHSHPINEAYIIYKERYRNNMGNILFVKEPVKDETHCGVVSSHYFVQDNIQLFNEGVNNNTCLNRKLSIDKFGTIKNCPSMSKGFGHYKDMKLSDFLLLDGFKDTWTIPKSQISICQDCEYRNACVDCRAYITDPKNIYSKPSKCGYDPYTAQWSKSTETINS